MKPIDVAKAVGLALAVLVLLIATAAIYIWSWVVEPGHPKAYYVSIAPRIAGHSTRVFGTALCLAAMWLLARRRPERNPYLFALCFFAAYLLLDFGMVGFRDVYNLEVGLSVLVKLAGTLLGAWLGARAARPSPAAA